MLSILPRIRVLLFLALALAVALAVYLALESQTARPLAQVSVLVAATNLQVAEPITPSMVLVREVPAADVPGPAPALASDMTRVLASSPQEPIYAGEVIQLVHLFGPGLAVSGAPDLSLLKNGYGLIAVRANRFNMPGSGLQSGDHVALFATLQKAPVRGPDGGASVATSQLEVITIDPSAVVMSVNLNAIGPDAGEVTLAVPRSEMKTIIMANALGTFTFVPIRPDDSSQGPAAIVRAQDLEREQK